MASIYDLKPRFQNLLRPLTRALFAAGITANQVTVAAALLSVAVGACIALLPTTHWPLLVLPAFLFVRMALNAVDGLLAREHGQKSRLGAVLNEVGDVVADTALFFPSPSSPASTRRSSSSRPRSPSSPNSPASSACKSAQPAATTVPWARATALSRSASSPSSPASVCRWRPGSPPPSPSCFSCSSRPSSSAPAAPSRRRPALHHE